MSFVYKGLQKLKTPVFLKTFNKITFVNNFDQILPQLYLGNIESSKDIKFLTNNNISAVVNCTENEPFDKFFDDEDLKYKLRVDIKDNRDPENLELFYSKIHKTVLFIEDQIHHKNNIVLVHCYWGFMRSATIVACYLIKKFNFLPHEAVQYIQDRRYMALNKFYNFNDLLIRYYNDLEKMKKKDFEN